MSTETDLRRIVSALEGRKEGNSWRCRCPCHEGRSLIVTLEGETLLCNCKQGCSQEDVIAALKERNLWPNGTTPAAGQVVSQAATLEAEYPYIGEGGAPVAIKGRFRKPNGDKTFAWKRPGADDWKGLRGLKERDLPLYNGHLIPTADGTVIVCEGEKAANACLDAGLLAVCPPGGASGKDFGDQPKALAGRDVILWPDNDGEGRALMQRFSVKLQGIAASVRTIALDVPVKGDAYDYFSAGGTKGGVLGEAAKIRTAPWIEETTTGYVVSIPDSGGAVRFAFENLEQRRQSLHAIVTSWQEVAGSSREPYTAHLDLLSSSSRDTYRKQIEAMLALAKDSAITWLNRACTMVRQTHAERDYSVDLGPLPTTLVTRYLAPPFVLTDGPSILFGDGGTMKTYLSLLLGVCVATGTDFLGRTCQRARVLFVDYEASAVRIKARLTRILTGLGQEWRDDLGFIYWPAQGRPLSSSLPALQRKVKESDVGLVIVDSAALACGGNPKDEELALQYFNGLASLGVPSLSLAHVVKDGDKDRYPLGSIFWHNSARLTWNTKLAQEPQEGTAHLGCFNRKSNDDLLAAPIGVCVTFDADSARFSTEAATYNWSQNVPLSISIRELLDQGRMSVKELSAATSTTEDTVSRTLRRLSGLQRLDRSPDNSFYWGLKRG